MGDDRPPRYVEDGRVIYRASGLGLCDKIFVALAMDYSPRSHPAWFQEVLDEGTRNEHVIREMYSAMIECPIEGAGTTWEKEVIPGVWVRGSTDGFFFKDGMTVPALFEAKKIRPSGWTKFLRSGVECQANYPMQLATYMHLMAEAWGIDEVDAHFVGGHYDPEKDLVTEVVPHVYIMPPVPWRGIAMRITRLERQITEALRDGTPIGDVACTNKTYPCPMFYLHDEDDDEPPVRPSDDVVAPLLQEYATLEQEIAALSEKQARIKTIKDGVKEWLRKSGQESGDVSQVSVGDDTWDLKFLTSPRKGHWVQDSEATTVTIRQRKAEGEDTGAKAVKKSAPRKRASK